MAARPFPEADRVAYQEIDFVAPRARRHRAKDAGRRIRVRRLALHRAAAGCSDGRAGPSPRGRGRRHLPRLARLRHTPRSRSSRTRSTRGRRAVFDANLGAPARAPPRPANRRRYPGRRAARSRRTIDVGEHALFPPEVERLFADTYDTLVRVTEELDIARELLAGVHDHQQSKVVEGQDEVAKKLTVIASLVLVPSLIVGSTARTSRACSTTPYWSIGVSPASSSRRRLVSARVFRWRRWI